MTIVVTTAFANNSIGGGGNVIVSLWQQASSTAIKALSKYTDVWINTLCDETGSNCFDVSTGIGGAPVGATYITQTTNATLTNEQALAALATGIVKNTTTTGVLSIAAQGTDYYAPAGTDVAVADGGLGLSTLVAQILFFTLLLL